MRPSVSLARHREEVLQVLSRYGVRNPQVFGSVARGDDTEGSDLDLLVDFGNPPTYFDIFEIENELSELLGCRVEIGTKLRPHAAIVAADELRPL